MFSVVALVIRSKPEEPGAEEEYLNVVVDSTVSFFFQEASPFLFSILLMFLLHDSSTETHGTDVGEGSRQVLPSSRHGR